MFALLDQELQKFRGWSGLACKSGCGKCCTKPNIEATVLEFLPFAEHLYRINEAEVWLVRLAAHEVGSDSSICALFNPQGIGGNCTQYAYRGLICRLFGFSSRTNKYARRELVTCETIKTEQAASYAEAVTQIEGGGFIPVMNHFYMRLLAVDSSLGKEFYPINEAIRRAIETVLHYHAYEA